MPAIPPILLKKLYVKGSLRAQEDGFALDLNNPIAPGTILGFRALELDGSPIAIEQVVVVPPDGQVLPAADITTQTPLQFPLGATVALQVAGTDLQPGEHHLNIQVVVQDVGPLKIPVADRVA